MKKNKVLKNKWLLLVFGVVLGSLIAYIVYSSYIVVSVKEIDTDIVVMDHFGLDAGTDALHFGGVPPGMGAGLRGFEIYNNNDFPVKATAYLSGDFVSWITIKRNDIILGPNEYAKLSFTAKPPLDAELGKYNGTITVVFKRIW